MRSSLLLSVVLGFLLFAPPAHAESAEDRAAADVLFKEARTLLESKKFADACAKFAASQKLDPKPGRLLALGDCYEQKGDTASAWATFREAVSAAKITDDDARAKEGERRAGLLETNLSKLVIKVPPDARVTGLEVRRNGTILDQALWGIAIPVDPGPQIVDAHARGKHSWSLTVDIPSTPGTTTAEVPVLTDDPSGKGTSMSLTSKGKSIPLIVAGGTMGLLGMGTGIALVALSSGFRTDALAMRDALPEAVCSAAHPQHVDHVAECNELTQTLARRDTFWNAGAILIPVGGIFAIGTWIYTLVPTAKFTKSAFSVTPVATPGFSGVMMNGSF